MRLIMLLEFQILFEKIVVLFLKLNILFIRLIFANNTADQFFYFF